MEQKSLEERVEMLEKTVERLEKLPDRMLAVEGRLEHVRHVAEPDAEVDPAGQRHHPCPGSAGQDGQRAEGEPLVRVRHHRDGETDHRQQDDGDRGQEAKRPDESEHLPSIRYGVAEVVGWSMAAPRDARYDLIVTPSAGGPGRGSHRWPECGLGQYGRGTFVLGSGH